MKIKISSAPNASSQPTRRVSLPSHCKTPRQTPPQKRPRRRQGDQCFKQMLFQAKPGTVSTVSAPSAETQLAAHAINQQGRGRAGPRALRTQLQSSRSAKPRWHLTLLQKAGVGKTGVTGGGGHTDPAVPRGGDRKKSHRAALRGRAGQRRRGLRGLGTELSTAGLAQHPGGTADTTPSPVAVTRRPAGPDADAARFPPASAAAQQPQATGSRAAAPAPGRYSPSRSQRPPPPCFPARAC